MFACHAWLEHCGALLCIVAVCHAPITMVAVTVAYRDLWDSSRKTAAS